MSYIYSEGRPCRAMPPLAVLLSDNMLIFISQSLIDVEIHLYPHSLSTERSVRRVPIKPVPQTVEEADHMALHSDGLQYFEPVDVYDTNIQSYPGLIASLATCAGIDGFGVVDSPRRLHYSSLLLDVSTFWMTFRLLYSFTGCYRILHDLFLILGPWHIYMYAHVVVWDIFRSSFLAGAFFAIFPNEKLFFRPKLAASVTFFTWLRASFPIFRKKLMQVLNTLKSLSSLYEIQLPRVLKSKKVLPSNPYRRAYIRLYNLLYLCEFVLTALADFGCAIKLQNYAFFQTSLLRVASFMLAVQTRGLPIYQRTVVVMLSLLRYWETTGLPVMEFFKANCTFLSEESGELAISCLTRNLPTNMRADYQQTRSSWQQIKMKYRAANEETPPPKKYRIIRTPSTTSLAGEDDVAIQALANHFVAVIDQIA